MSTTIYLAIREANHISYFSTLISCSDTQQNSEVKNLTKNKIEEKTESIETVDITPQDVDKNEKQEPKDNLAFIKIPSGKYTRSEFKKALADVAINVMGEITIYDDASRINDIDEYEPQIGKMEFTFVATSDDGETLEESVLITLEEEPETTTEPETEATTEPETETETTTEPETETTTETDTTRVFSNVLAAMDWDLSEDEATYKYNFIFLFLEGKKIARISKAGLFLEDVFTAGASGLFKDPILTNFDKLTAQVPISTNDWRSYFYFDAGSKLLEFDRNHAGFTNGGIKSNNWSNMSAFSGLITAACQGPNDAWHHAYFFLNDGRWVEYQMSTTNIVTPAGPTSNTFDFTEEESKNITACVKVNTDTYLFFLKGGKIVRYNMTTHKKSTGYPKLIEEQWPEIFTD